MPNHALYLGSRESEWSEPDLSILDNGRDAVPAVPLDLVPEPWRKWIADTASAAGAPQDYVLQTVLAGVAGVCGAGVRVRVTPAWTEPLVMWQAMVGEPSTGKSAALAPMRRLLGTIEQERCLHDEERCAAHAEQAKKGRDDRPFVPSRVVMTDTGLEAVAETVSGNPRGVLLWRDLPKVWFGDDVADDRECAAWLEAWTAGAVTLERCRRPPLDLASFPVSILETMCPDSLKTALLEGDKGLPTRFLYVWPGPQDYRALAALEPVRDDEVLDRLRRLSTLARTPDDPCELRVDERGVKALDSVLIDLHAARRSAEGTRGRMAGQGQDLHRPVGGSAGASGIHWRPTQSARCDRQRAGRSGGRAMAELLLGACTRGVRQRRALGSQATRAPRRALAARHAPHHGVTTGDLPPRARPGRDGGRNGAGAPATSLSRLRPARPGVSRQARSAEHPLAGQSGSRRR